MNAAEHRERAVELGTQAADLYEAKRWERARFAQASAQLHATLAVAAAIEEQSTLARRTDVKSPYAYTCIECGRSAVTRADHAPDCPHFFSGAAHCPDDPSSLLGGA